MKVDLRIPDIGVLDGHEVESLGNGLFRIEEPTFGPMFGEEVGDPDELVDYKDIVELELLPDGTYELRAIRSRGGWQKLDFILSRKFVQSGALDAAWSRIEAEGGICIQEALGMLRVYLPPDSTWDPMEVLG